MPKRPARPRLAAPVDTTHKVTAINFQAEVEYRDKVGRVVKRELSPHVAIYEAQFFPELIAYLRSLGLKVDSPPTAPVSMLEEDR
jgi:hypothetical protein